MDNFIENFRNAFQLAKNIFNNREPETLEVKNIGLSTPMSQEEYKAQAEIDLQATEAEVQEAMQEAIEEEPARYAAKEVIFKPNNLDVDYEAEFVNFVNRNAPQGFSQKLNEMKPFMITSLIAWPSYWLLRGVYWHQKRNNERIGLYIHRTFQHAKIMQVAILAAALLMGGAMRDDRGLKLHDVENSKK